MEGKEKGMCEKWMERREEEEYMLKGTEKKEEEEVRRAPKGKGKEGDDMGWGK